MNEKDIKIKKHIVLCEQST